MATLLTGWDQTTGMTFVPTWRKVDDSRFYGGSYVWADFTSLTSTSPAAVKFSFQGKGVSFYGISPFNPDVVNSKLPLSVIIDTVNTPPKFPLYPEPNGVYGELYRSPELPTGKHNITISNLYGAYIDFAVVYSDPNATRVNNSRILVDDSDPAMQYRGSWVKGQDETFSGSSSGLGGGGAIREIPSRAMGNTTHSTRTVGDRFGVTVVNTTAITVYGIIDSRVNGTIGVTWTLDGTPVNKVYQIPAPGIEPAAGGHLLNQKVFESGMKLGNHTLEAQITSITEGQVFIIDFLSYFTVLSSSGSGTSTSRSGSTGTPSPKANHSSSKRLVGPIVGGVLGALALGIAAIILIAWLKRRRRAERKERTMLRADPLILNGNGVPESKSSSYPDQSTVQTPEVHSQKLKSESYTVTSRTEPDDTVFGLGSPTEHIPDRASSDDGREGEHHNESIALTTQQRESPNQAIDPHPHERPTPPPITTELSQSSAPATAQSPGARTDMTELNSRVDLLTREVRRMRRSFLPFFTSTPPSYDNTGNSAATNLPSYVG
ncbi:hypothetical protein L218DRAFT_947447 [Marasmius fiardii PR-910]|nr:hypothetical protein L218DRAFT_947447 [Marasmius fiardii PR-910]